LVPDHLVVAVRRLEDGRALDLVGRPLLDDAPEDFALVFVRLAGIAAADEEAAVLVADGSEDVDEAAARRALELVIVRALGLRRFERSVVVAIAHATISSIWYGFSKTFS